MSCSINGTTITLTRGDTFRAYVSIAHKDGTEYTPVDGDSVRFALKRNAFNRAGSGFADTEPLIYKAIPNDTLLLQIDPEDTKPLAFGSYFYDIKITMADGTVDTFISDATMVLTPEAD